MKTIRSSERPSNPTESMKINEREKGSGANNEIKQDCSDVVVQEDPMAHSNRRGLRGGLGHTIGEEEEDAQRGRHLIRTLRPINRTKTRTSQAVSSRLVKVRSARTTSGIHTQRWTQTQSADLAVVARPLGFPLPILPPGV